MTSSGIKSCAFKIKHNVRIHVQQHGLSCASSFIQSDDLDLPVVFVTAHDSFERTGPKSAIRLSTLNQEVGEAGVKEAGSPMAAKVTL